MVRQRGISILGWRSEEGGGSAFFWHVMNRIPRPSRAAIRAAIAASLRSDEGSLRDTACRLGVSARSLQRHLAAAGTSHSELIAEVRIRRACRLLAAPDQRIRDVAARLGFANAGSFSRAFMRMMKVQPRVYRRQQMDRSEYQSVKRKSA